MSQAVTQQPKLDRSGNLRLLQVLQEELAGYAEYAWQTRYRLLPGIW